MGAFVMSAVERLFGLQPRSAARPAPATGPALARAVTHPESRQAFADAVSDVCNLASDDAKVD